jgi:predicted RecB family nuclease
MSQKITEKTFYQFIKCPHWVYLDAHHLEDRPHHQLLLKLMDDGLIEEKAREVISDREEVAEVKAEDLEEAFNQTLEYMAQGVETIYRGVLIDKHWVGHPDVLEKVEGKSRFGDYYYVAADLKSSRRMKDEYKFQGCFYAELLEKIQKVKPVQGYVINPEGETQGYLIEDFEHEYELTLSKIEEIVAGKEPPHFLTSGCRQSPWFSECRTKTNECDDLSLLNRVWKEEVIRLRASGVKTISELSTKSINDLEALVPTMRAERLEILRDQAIAISEERYLIRGPVDFPESEIEVYFDIESNPLRDFDYLFGVLVVKGGEENYYAFTADGPEDEAKMWDEFVGFLERHHDAMIYHYGLFEQEVMRRFAARYGVSKIAQEVIDRNMIDLLYLFRPHVIFPLSFYTLKDIACYLGFSWRSEDASGANSVVWHEEWLASKNDAFMKKIKEYNEDDVRATHLIKEWLEKNTM